MTRAVRNRLIARVAARRRGEQGLTLIELLLVARHPGDPDGLSGRRIVDGAAGFRRRSRERDRE